jgi:thiol peroxidase
MNIERTGLIQFAGEDVTIIGEDVQVGQSAPEFTAHTKEWSEVKALESTNGKVRIIGSLLSMETSVCDKETRQFNIEAAKLSDDIAIIMVSMDLPFTLKNWCSAAGIDEVITLSDHKYADFGEKYGVLIKEQRFLRRAVFIVDENDQVIYADYMSALGDEPDYSEVLETARAALNG